MVTPLPLIHNPAAGGGQGLARFRQAQALLQAAGVTTVPHPTQRPRHAGEIANTLARQGCSTLLVLGGDGTVSEVAAGLLALPCEQRPTLGCLPAGTGNDFVRDFGICDLASAVERIRSGSPQPADAIEVQWPSGRSISINVVGTGLMALAGDRCNRHWKWLGRRGYDLAAMIEIFRMGACPTRLILDGQDVSGNYPLVAACNSRCTGGAMQMAPQASVADGLLDVVTIENPGRLELLHLLLTRLRKGLHVQHPKVQLRRAACVEIAPQVPSPLLVDGELIGQTPVRLQVLPGALRILG